MPTIKASASFPTTTTLGMLDGDQYQSNGKQAWPSVNVFFRQVRNLVFDTTAIPASANALAIHWPTGQATSLTNVVFRLSQASGNNHVGLFIEDGSGGLLNDLVFYGGMYGAKLGNQQFTARNLTFYNAQVAAINQVWDWGWTYKSLSINNCPTGILISDTTTGSQVILDSTFNNVNVGISTPRVTGTTTPPQAGSLYLFNVVFNNVPTILDNPYGAIIQGMAGASITESGFAMGNVYDPNGPIAFIGTNASWAPHIGPITNVGKIYEQSKPQYENQPASSFIFARDFGAAGDGNTDDTAALNNLFATSAQTGKIAFVDAGTYVVTDTVDVPAGARLVGEALAAVLMATGSRFGDISAPYPVLRVGESGDAGRVDVSDLIVSTRGFNPGAKLIEYNLASPTTGPPAGLWDVHTRIGGFAGTNLQLAQCPTTPSQVDYANPNCIAAFMSLHITPSAANVYLENNWFWVADHDLEDPNYTQITVFAGRGMLVESRTGPVWLSGTATEHHTLYQYQLANTQNVYASMPQTETPYYQPNPPANLPFPMVGGYNDPDFVADCAGVATPGACPMAWGMRVLSSRDVVIFGSGFYSFFNNYDVSCAQPAAATKCQARIVAVGDLSGGKATSDVFVFGLDTVGVTSMATRYGQDLALYTDNVAGFASTVIVFNSP